MLDLQLGRGHPRTKAVLDAKQFDNRGGGWGARMAQWRERSPPTNVARVCCWFSLLREFQFKLERTDTFQRVLMNSLVLHG